MTQRYVSVIGPILSTEDSQSPQLPSTRCRHAVAQGREQLHLHRPQMLNNYGSGHILTYITSDIRRNCLTLAFRFDAALSRIVPYGGGRISWSLWGE